MYHGKHTGITSGKRAGKNSCGRGKSTALILVLILLLGMTIGGTIAYLFKMSHPVVNTFTSADVEIDIDEDVTDTAKTSVKIENKGNIPVFIRVSLVGNWADAEHENEICIKHGNEQPYFTCGSDWLLGSDGFYYYKYAVEGGASTTDLLGSDIELEMADDGCSYQVEVIASAIQSEPADTFGTVWESSGYRVSSDGITLEKVDEEVLE